MFRRPVVLALSGLLFALALARPAVAGVPPAVADDRPGPGDVTPAIAHYDLEVLYGEARMEEGLALARKQLAANPDDAELYRHVVRFLFEKGEMVHKDDKSMDKVALYKEMYDLSNKGLELDPGNAHLLFNRGIALGRLSTTRGVLSSLMNLKGVEEDWLAAAAAPYRYQAIAGAEHLPCDTYLTLGIFYRLVPDWWIVGVLAGTRGDLDKSLAWLEKANQCRPNRIRTLKELGVTQLCIGDSRKQPEMIERGRATLIHMRTLPKAHTHSEIDKEHALLLINDPSLACEYSRDGQQENDREKLEGK
jgi:tetratricopeptide (TPR) repeat protein